MTKNKSSHFVGHCRVENSWNLLSVANISYSSSASSSQKKRPVISFHGQLMSDPWPHCGFCFFWCVSVCHYETCLKAFMPILIRIINLNICSYIVEGIDDVVIFWQYRKMSCLTEACDSKWQWEGGTGGWRLLFTEFDSASLIRHSFLDTERCSFQTALLPTLAQLYHTVCDSLQHVNHLIMLTLF